MRALVQRVSSAKVSVNGSIVGSIHNGLLVFIGVGTEDTEEDVRYLVDKIVNLRIFSDSAGKFNHSALDLGYSLLVVSQFTLFADCSQGRRPFFGEAASPEFGKRLYDLFCNEAKKLLPVETGLFGSHMLVNLCNDGPVTIWLDSKAR